MTLLPDILKMLKITQKAISNSYDITAQETVENMPFSEFVRQLPLGTLQYVLFIF